MPTLTRDRYMPASLAEGPNGGLDVAKVRAELARMGLTDTHVFPDRGRDKVTVAFGTDKAGHRVNVHIIRTERGS